MAETTLALDLHRVLLKLRDAGSGKKRIDHAWRTALNAGASYELLYEGLKLLAAAFAKLATQVSENPALQSSWEKHLARIGDWRLLVAPENLSKPCSEFAGVLSDDRLDHLLTLSDALSREYPEGALDEPDLESIRSGIEELGEHVRGADLNDRLREFLVAQLGFLRFAIDNASTLGFDSMYEVVMAAMARLHLEICKRPEHASQPEVGRFRQIARGVLEKLDAVKRLHGGTQAIEGLAEQGQSLLTSGLT